MEITIETLILKRSPLVHEGYLSRWLQPNPPPPCLTALPSSIPDHHQQSRLLASPRGHRLLLACQHCRDDSSFTVFRFYQEIGFLETDFPKLTHIYIVTSTLCQSHLILQLEQKGSFMIQKPETQSPKPQGLRDRYENLHKRFKWEQHHIIEIRTVLEQLQSSGGKEEQAFQGQASENLEGLLGFRTHICLF